jgi:pimeloyl-ACP methyl ester carboxylesterase
MMFRKRPSSLVNVGLATLQHPGKPERKPLSFYYPEDQVRRATFDAGFDLGWKLTAVETPRSKPAPFKFVVIAGAPSWSDYWAEFLTQLPEDREMVVVDRPGFGANGPKTCIGDIRLQAAALQPMLKAPFGQKIILVGHSYGAAIATLMAANNPGKVAGLVLLSGYFGEFGSTSRLLVRLGSKVMRLIPRDLRHAILEVTGQKSQLGHMRDALSKLRTPVHVIHGDKDDYAPVEAAEKMVQQIRTRRPVRFERIEGGDHFMHDGMPERLLEALERCIPPHWTQQVLGLAKLKIGGKTDDPGKDEDAANAA